MTTGKMYLKWRQSSDFGFWNTGQSEKRKLIQVTSMSIGKGKIETAKTVRVTGTDIGYQTHGAVAKLLLYSCGMFGMPAYLTS